MDRLVQEYVKRMTKDDVNSFAIKNGINLTDDELDLIYRHIKDNWRTIMYGNPRGILNELKDKLSPDSYQKIEGLYVYFKNRYL